MGKVTDRLCKISGDGTAARGKYEILNPDNRKNDSWKIRKRSQFEEGKVGDMAVKFLYIKWK